MALADRLRACERDADVEVRAIAERAAAEASRVTAAAARERGDQIATATRAFADERRAVGDAEVAAAARAARTEVLEARAALLDREWPQLACEALALERAR